MSAYYMQRLEFSIWSEVTAVIGKQKLPLPEVPLLDCLTFPVVTACPCFMFPTSSLKLGAL